MTANSQLDLSQHVPLIAILRGIKPANILSTAEHLIKAGFTMIEVPLNSPDALTSIRALVTEFGNDFAVGAGTVTQAEQANQVVDTGANLLVTPNFNAEVVQIAKRAGCASFIGIMTPSEAFAALQAGATALKLFPTALIGVAGYKALREVLPAQTTCFAVGGIKPSVESMRPWHEAGIAGYGIGTGLFKPEFSEQQIAANAKMYIDAWHELQKATPKESAS